MMLSAAMLNIDSCTIGGMDKKAVEKIKKVTPQDIINCANKYFNDTYVLTVLKP